MFFCFFWRGGGGCTTLQSFGQPRFTLLTHNSVSLCSKGKAATGLYTQNYNLCATAPNFQITNSHLTSETFILVKPSQGNEKTQLLNSLRGKYVYNSVGHTKRRSFSFTLLGPKVTVEWWPLLSSQFETQSTDRRFRSSYFSVALDNCIPRPFQFMTDLHPTALSLKTNVLG